MRVPTGYTSTSYGSYSTALGKGSESVAFYCPPDKNSTCPLQSQMP